MRDFFAFCRELRIKLAEQIWAILETATEKDGMKAIQSMISEIIETLILDSLSPPSQD